jgi:carbonic anhydrase/acetyltransferase-like protein (isoleucine patch superfamily)
MIAAGAVVPAKMVCETGYIYAGIPAKKIKKLNESVMHDFFKQTPENYKKYSKWYLDEGYGKKF